MERFGALSDNEMFTFSPFLFAGGKQGLETVRKVNSFVHYDIVGQMKDPGVLTNRDLLRKGGIRRDAGLKIFFRPVFSDK